MLGFRSPTQFGDEQAAHAAAERAEAARREQKVEWAVAPGATLETPRGVLREGEEVTLQDVIDPLSSTPAWKRMETLVRRGIVLHADEHTLRAAKCPADAPYRVGPGALTSTRGILVPGEPCSAEDFGSQEQLDYLVSRGRVIARQRTAQTAMPNRRSKQGPEAA